MNQVRRINGLGGASQTRPETFGAEGARALDELLRRKLKVGNPSDVTEMLRALQARYPDKDALLTAESLGFAATALPSTALAPPSGAAGPRRSFSAAEYETVLSDMKADFATVVSAPSNRDIGVEISGWRDLLLKEYAEGSAGARLAQDAGKRERALLAVRRLNEYAWVARLIGIPMGELYWDFRRLAVTLDNAADIVRILIGEALYEVGLGYNGLLLQVPATDLRLRGESAVEALTGLIAGEEGIFDDWGERFRAYNDFFERLDPELKPYARPEGLKDSVDGLVNTFSNGMSSMTADSLRQLAATAPLEVGRLRRVLRVASNVQGSQPSSALSIFVQSLALFLAAFDSSRGGALYIDLGLPAPLAARKLRPMDIAARNLLRRLVDYRSQYAETLEGTLAFELRTARRMKELAYFDLGLFLVNLAIDTVASSDSTPAF
jgi:hypothetical protein